MDDPIHCRTERSAAPRDGRGDEATMGSSIQHPVLEGSGAIRHHSVRYVTSSYLKLTLIKIFNRNASTAVLRLGIFRAVDLRKESFDP